MLSWRVGENSLTQRTVILKWIMIYLETPIILSGKSFISLFISNVTEACYMSSCTQNARGRETS